MADMLQALKGEEGLPVKGVKVRSKRGRGRRVMWGSVENPPRGSSEKSLEPSIE